MQGSLEHRDEPVEDPLTAHRLETLGPAPEARRVASGEDRSCDHGVT
jgi:hypothetical protein